MIYLLIRTYVSGGVRLMDTYTDREKPDSLAEEANRRAERFDLPWRTSVVERDEAA